MNSSTPLRYYDLIIIGTGAGGGTLAHALCNSGMKILLIERGDFLPQEAENWNEVAVWHDNRYQTQERWLNGQGRPFRPLQHYWVGGNTKVYGTALPRLRQADFGRIEHEGGLSPAWPVSYQQLEPYYQRAEELYLVHGCDQGDPTAPPRSAPFPFPPLPHAPEIEQLVKRWQQQDLNPCSLPLGIDFQTGGHCRLCSTCENHPCQVLAKSDADTRCVRPALKQAAVDLLTRTFARRLLTDPSGRRVIAVEVERNGEIMAIEGERFVVACGAINSAALLLRSANDKQTDGLANSSGLVGRNFMGHNVTFFIAFRYQRSQSETFQKTWQMNDFYFGGPDFPYPLGTVQANGNWPLHVLLPNILHKPCQRLLKGHYLVLAAMSEDLPDPNNRVVLTANGRIQIHYKANNVLAHQRLSKIVRRLLHQAGYPLLLAKSGIADVERKIAHQCGTLRFGSDPSTSVLDPFGRTHDIENLYCVDGSFFPSSSAQNPTLTIIAQALRLGDHLLSAIAPHPQSALISIR